MLKTQNSRILKIVKNIFLQNKNWFIDEDENCFEIKLSQTNLCHVWKWLEPFQAYKHHAQKCIISLKLKSIKMFPNLTFLACT